MDHIYEKQLPEDQRPFLPKLEALLPPDSPVVIDSIEGMRVREGKLLIGYRLGPSLDISGALHELGHLLDIDDARVISHGWGLRLPTVDGMFEEPTSTKPSERECSTVAWQILLGRAIGFNDNEAEFTVQALKWMPDFSLIEAGRDVEWGKLRDAARIAWLRGLIDEHLKVRTIEMALAELARKVEVVRAKLNEKV